MTDGRRRAADLESRRNAATCLALMGLLAFAAGLIGLATLVLPRFFMAFVGIMVVFGGFILLHYLTWGRWLSRPRATDEDPEWQPDAPTRDAARFGDAPDDD